MAIPDFQTIMLPLLRHLGGGRARSRDLIEAMSSKFALDADERAMLLPSGRQPVIANRVNWAASYLYAARLLDRVSRGVYEINERGRSVVANPPDRITIQYLQRFPEFLLLRPNAQPVEGDALLLPSISNTKLAAATETVQSTAPTPDEQIAAAVALQEQQVRADLLQFLLASTPARFEQTVVDLMLALGYGNAAEDAGETLGRSGDGGVDGVIREDRLGLDLIYLQAKRYADTAISVDQIRAFAGALDDKGARKGVFITTSVFTRDAESFAKRQQQKRLVLIDRDRLTVLMLRHGVGVRAAGSPIILKRVDQDYFDPDDAL